MAGTPVFRGTRIPVYLIADMVEKGSSIQEILEGYPSPTGEMVQYASIYATTHPRLGRPPVAPWSGKTPVGRKEGQVAACNVRFDPSAEKKDNVGIGVVKV